MERRIQNKFIKSAYSDSGLVNKFSPRVGVGGGVVDFGGIKRFSRRTKYK